MGGSLLIDPAKQLATALAGLWTDRHHRWLVKQTFSLLIANGGLHQLNGVRHRLAAAEADGIHLAIGQGLQRLDRNGLGAAGFVGGHLHHPRSRLCKCLSKHGASAALHPRQQNSQPPS